MIQPYPFDTLPRVSREEIALVEGLHRNDDLWQRWSRELASRLDVTLAMDLGFVGVGRPREPALGAGFTAALCDASANEVAWLHMDVSLAQALASLVLTGESPETIEMRPLLEIEGEALAVLLSHLCALDGAGLQAKPTRELFSGCDPTELLGQVRLKITLAHCSGLMTLWVSERAWKVLGRAQSREGFPAGETSTSAAVWQRHVRVVRLSLSRFRCSTIELEGLERGDILLPAAWSKHRALQRGVLLFGHHRVACGSIGRRGELTFAFEKWGDAVNFEKKEQDPEECVKTAVNASRPQLESTVAQVQDPERTVEMPARTVDLVVGRLEMSLAELATLRPGRVLTLETAVDEPVELVEGDRTIGWGQLVEVEGRLGVRVI